MTLLDVHQCSLFCCRHPHWTSCSASTSILLLHADNTKHVCSILTLDSIVSLHHAWSKQLVLLTQRPTHTLSCVQGCWGDESSLMMLPNMTPEAIPQLASKGFQAVPQLCQAASENAANLRSTLTSVMGSSRDASEIMQVSRLCTERTGKLA